MNLDVYLAIDIETSGFGADAQILEVAVIHYWKGKVVRRYTELVCPMGLSFDDEKVKKALEVNKLSVEALMYGASTFKKVRERLESEISEPVWVMHNSEFDMRMLTQEYTRLERELPAAPLVLCTKALDELINPGQKGHKLAEVAARWGVSSKTEHRAYGDAETCGDIFSKMLEVLPKTYEDLHDFYTRRQTLQWYKQIRGLT